MASLLECDKWNFGGQDVQYKHKWIYFLRQAFICSGAWTVFFLIGQFLGAPTVFIPQIRKAANSTDVLNDELASWLYSVFGFAASPWLFVLPLLIRYYGPRTPYGLVCLGSLIAYSIFYFSVTPQQILIGEIVAGIAHACCLTVGIVIVTEYSSPEYRGMFLTIKSASLTWGMWSANAIGTFFHWKCIAYTGFLCCMYMFTFIFWPESPHWLASKGRIDECRESFRWLHGNSENSEKQLDQLLISQAKRNVRQTQDWGTFSDAFATIRNRQFYLPLLLSALLVLQYNLTGKMVCATYSIDILKRMTASESAAYTGMLILDGVTVFAMYFGCYLANIFNRRTLYLTSSFIGIAFLFIVSLYLYLVRISVIVENQVLSILLMTCFSIAMGCGPMILNTSIYAEVLPARFKYIQLLITGLIFYIIFAATLKLAPFVFKTFGMHGAFLFYGLSSGVCTSLLYKYLPETKDKTLEEIEEYFKDAAEIRPEIEKLNKNDSREK